MKTYRLQVRAENDFRAFYFHFIYFLLYHFYVHLLVLFDISQPSALINHFILIYSLFPAAVMTQFAHSAH